MGKNIANTTHTFLFCDGGSCQKAGSENVVRAARAYLRNNELWESTHTIKTRCNGRCEDAPTCIVNPSDSWYKNLSPNNIIPIVKSHLENTALQEEDLLFTNTWQELASDNERPPVKPKPFELKNDTELNECHITRGFSSDQYLYPLFLFLQDNSEGITLSITGKDSILFKEVVKVEYADKYNLELFTKTDCIPLTIAGVPKEKPELFQTKISSTEYFYQIATQQAGIRFKNKFGVTLGKIEFDSIANKAWKYCIQIQLQNTPLKLA